MRKHGPKGYYYTKKKALDAWTKNGEHQSSRSCNSLQAPYAIPKKKKEKNTAPRNFLSDNGTEFRNYLLKEISKQFGVKHCFTVSYYLSSNTFVEHVNRKILEVVHPAVGELLETWEDLLPQVAASINRSVFESTGQSPHFILFWAEKKRLLYELLSSSNTFVYNVDVYVKMSN